MVTVSEVGGVPLAAPDLDIIDLSPLTAADPLGRKWCPSSGSERLGARTSFDYRLSELVRSGGACGSSGLITLDRQVVAVGRSGGEVRRVRAKLQANVALLSGAAVQSASKHYPLAMSGTARILGDARSNHDITGYATNVISGNATPGSGHTATKPTTGPTVAGSKSAACENFNLPNVAQGDAPTNNDNLIDSDQRTPASRPSRCCRSPASCRSSAAPGDVDYNATTRTLTVTGNGRAMLTAGHLLVLLGGGARQRGDPGAPRARR